MLEDLDCCWNFDDDGCFLEKVGRQIAAAADVGRQVAAACGDCSCTEVVGYREEVVLHMVGMGG